ncbi:hypothetical protein WHR41_01571 [Cladosporium halotolerans]|uniref:PH domain-containing protein n=1 Tax=Cladosporium halotolerans TaxID=1052096 RepID=A0AB34KXM1_9PEZI
MASPTAPHQQTNLPTRTATNTTDPDDAIPDEDSSETTKLFNERLQAWKHACGYLEDYITATEKMHHAHQKEYERVLKTVSNPLKEGHHFDQTLGGIAGLFDNIRSNTQGMATSHGETAKTLKGSILPIFERLHTEIKNKTKELTKGAGKGAKAVDKARNTSQKHIELLGQHTAAFDSSSGAVKSHEDPYILQRQVYHRLSKQVLEENNNRDDMLSVQSHFAQFEAHVVSTFQNGLAQFNSIMQNQTEQTRNSYGDMIGVAQRITPDFEWNGFVKRNQHLLIDPNAPKRAVEQIGFANQDHRATQPLIAGSLERKGKLMKSYSTSFYAVTPSRYLHEFKTDDDFAKDPHPENSLYLPDCMIGAVDGVKFNVKGKDTSKGLMSKMSMGHEYHFRAHTPQDAQKWHDIIASQVGQATNETPTSPTGSAASPTGSVGEEGAYQSFHQGETGTTGTTAAPMTASEKDGLSSSAEPSTASPTTTTQVPEKDVAGASQGVYTADKA